MAAQVGTLALFGTQIAFEKAFDGAHGVPD
jgi:hypothetical protein